MDISANAIVHAPADTEFEDDAWKALVGCTLGQWMVRGGQMLGSKKMLLEITMPTPTEGMSLLGMLKDGV